MIPSTFVGLSLAAIAAGGLISAFTARQPSRATAWVSAYLVLVVGLIQLGLVTLWQTLGLPTAATVLLALLTYNLGNAGVITGTLLKRQLSYYRTLVNSGGILIAVAMALLLVAIRTTTASWSLVRFIVLTVVILISMPIGLLLSSRRHAAIKSAKKLASAELRR